MLSELKNPRQVPHEPRRRWFTDDYFDLIVWQSPEGEIIAFQLCYDKGPDERVLIWHRDEGFSHKGIDNGENRDGHYKMTPILIPDGEFNCDPIQMRFRKESRNIDPDVRIFIIDKLDDYR
jgi:hypothetical protein